MKIRDQAKGQWPRIISALLGEEFTNTRKHQPCPNGQGTDRFRFSDKTGTGNYFCACSDGGADGFELLMCVKGWTFAQAAEAVEGVIGECPKDKQDSDTEPQSWPQRLRNEVVKTKRSGYLEGRGLEVPGVLDWHTSLPYFDDGVERGRYPAMLAPVMRDGKFVTYHVTYLQDGGKAPVTPNRKLLSGGVSGGAVPLYPPSDGLIGVAEGIETAIAAKILFDTPVHAALNTTLLQKWRPPKNVTDVIIYADRDSNHAGQAAAHTLAHRLIGQGYEVVIAFPETVDTDWNDFLLQQRLAS